LRRFSFLGIVSPHVLPGRIMPKILKFTQFAIRDFLAMAGPPFILTVILCYIAYRLVDPTPPAHVTISTGQENGAYDEFGKRYAKRLARYGIQATLKPSLGSQQNLDRLKDANSGIDIAFVQSGSTRESEAIRNGLVSLGSLFTEPVWLFLREPLKVTQMTQLKGLKINVGPDGTGVPSLFAKLLSVNGLEPSDLQLSKLEDSPATIELLAGRIDGVVFSSAPDAPLIQMLLQTPGIMLFDFVQAEAYTRRFGFLSHVILPRGIVDLGRDLPSRDYHLIAPTATLVARESLHPALVELFVQSAARIHGRVGWFSRQGEFPTAHYVEIPVATEAEKFYKNGPPVLQRYMPFWLANFFERMWVVIVALGALILPLSRIVPPLYVWKVRSRVYRWYGKLRAVEQVIEDVPPEKRADLYQSQLERLNEIEDKVNQISIPLSFAEELYRLRSHIEMVRNRVLFLMRAA
jgi:hypothetical protein